MIKNSKTKRIAVKPISESMADVSEKARNMVERAEIWNDYFLAILGVVVGDSPTSGSVSKAGDLADFALAEYEERWKGV